ncbi:MAG: hypothetical protein CFE46_19060 [Burkholderiales bacterium PBB6]|nr:MAG: hypothetical protein CFE46_19060 [Burkholderiales bacterium PBB6]
MNQTISVWTVLVVAIVAANLPFLTERILLIGPQRAPRKAFGWRLLELVVLGAATLGIGFVLESSIGQRAPQGWEFYWAFGFLFTTLAFPGFVWRYLRRQ